VGLIGHGPITAYELISDNEENNGMFGVAVAGIGDVNGDGLGDVVVGAPDEGPRPGPTGAGRAYFYSGVNGELIRELASPNAEIFGGFGIAVANIGDVDDDGFDDVAIGASNEDPGTSPSGAGRVHLFSGVDGVFIRTLLSPTEEPDGAFGESVAGVPDLDDDGVGDVVVGAPGESPELSPERAGRVHVFSGATGDHIHELAAPVQTFDVGFGSAVRGAEDMDDDDMGEVLVGVPDESTTDTQRAGRAYVFSGQGGGLLYDLVSPNEELNGRFGWAVAGVGDLDGDMMGDFVVTARDETTSTTQQGGQAYVYSGATGDVLRILLSPTPEARGRFGSAVALVPDLDDDQVPDLIIGAEREQPDPGVADAGRVHVFSGATGTPIHTISSPNAESGAGFGIAVGGVPDFTEDGQGDLVVGAPREDPGEVSNAGRAYTHDGFTGIHIVDNAVEDWALYP